MKSYSSGEIIKILEYHGWYLYKIRGDHHQYKHLSIQGKITVPHPVKDLAKFIIKNIEHTSGIKF